MNGQLLVATDGSDASEKAIEYTRDRFEPDRTSILLVSVADESTLIPYGVGGETAIGGVGFDEIRENLEAKANEVVEEGKQTFEGKGFSVEGRTYFGDPGSLICEVAREVDAEAIILGRKGHTTVGEVLLGSVSHYVVHHSDRPVILVPSSSE